MILRVNQLTTHGVDDSDSGLSRVRRHLDYVLLTTRTTTVTVGQWEGTYFLFERAYQRPII